MIKAAHQTRAVPPARLDNFSTWLKALAEPNRLRIVDLLMQGEQCNCKMGDRLQMAPNLISHHLSVLQKAGLVSARRDPADARWIHYSMRTEVLAELNAIFIAFFDPARIKEGDSNCAPTSFISLSGLKASRG